jgi:hypothetical protein
VAQRKGDASLGVCGSRLDRTLDALERECHALDLISRIPLSSHFFEIFTLKSHFSLNNLQNTMLERCIRVNRLWVFWSLYSMLDLYIYMFLRGEGLHGEYAASPISSSILLLLFSYSFLSYKLTWYQSQTQLAVAYRHPFVARVGLDVLPPHVRGRVGSPTLLGY